MNEWQWLFYPMHTTKHCTVDVTTPWCAASNPLSYCKRSVYIQDSWLFKWFACIHHLKPTWLFSSKQLVFQQREKKYNHPATHCGRTVLLWVIARYWQTKANMTKGECATYQTRPAFSNRNGSHLRDMCANWAEVITFNCIILLPIC